MNELFVNRIGNGYFDKLLAFIDIVFEYTSRSKVKQEQTVVFLKRISTTTLPPTRIAFRRIQFYNKSLLQSPLNGKQYYGTFYFSQPQPPSLIGILLPEAPETEKGQRWNWWHLDNEIYDRERESDSWSVWIYALFYSNTHLTHYGIWCHLVWTIQCGN